jgi:uncharacterized repeat protein (TIGR02543 family)
MMSKLFIALTAVIAAAGLVLAGCDNPAGGDAAFTVSFNADGGTPAPSAQSVPSGGKVTAPAAMTKEGYTFGGWYTEPSLTNPWVFAADTVTANSTLYAKWTENAPGAFTVSFNADGGTPVPDDQSVGPGGAAAEPAAMTREGFSFDGWYADSSFEGGPWDFAVGIVTGNLVLYAKWELKTYTVTFDTSGGDLVPPQIVSHGGRADRPENPANSFYYFRAWFKDPELTEYYNFYNSITTDTTVYAGWAIDSDLLKNWLLEKSGGNSPDDPIPLTIKSVDVATAHGSILWIAGSIMAFSNGKGADKYVTVDLSACTSNDGSLDLYSSNGNGEEKIVSLILPDTVTSIQNGTSNTDRETYTVLKSVSGKNVENIGDYAFRGADVLEHIDFPNAKVIGKEAFMTSQLVKNTVLTNVSFPEATEIGPRAFLGCTVLQSLDFPKAVTIGEYAFSDSDQPFYENTVLTSVSFPEATTIGEFAFGSCTALEQVYFPKVQVVQGFGGNGEYGGPRLKSVGRAEFPSATSIGPNAFNACVSLETVDFPHISSIGEGAFNYCTSLSTINLNFSAITRIEALTFRRTLLVSADFPNAASIGWGAFEGCPALVSVNFPKVTAIEGNIDCGAFDNCAALESVNFPELTTIGESAFRGPSGFDSRASNKLTSVDFPKVTSIGADAFEGCAYLQSANFPLLESVPIHAFYYSNQLETLNIPLAAGIGDFALSSRNSAMTITLGQNAPAALGSNIFMQHVFGGGSVSGNTAVTVKVPAGAAGYDAAWQAALKGNSSITVTVVSE